MTASAFYGSKSVEDRFPGMIAEVEGIIRESERRYQPHSASADSFLWEHTIHVASLAGRLSRAEGSHPLIPAVTALFHDAGKFAGGKYHEDAAIEEQESARIAGRVLRRFGMKERDLGRVLAALAALYDPKAGRNALADLIHDADFLAKFGALGVAAFFLKSALRGRSLGSAVMRHLSKELTYAACLPANMRTKAGRKLAARKSAASLRFFRSLLAEMRDAGIADLVVRRMRIRHPVRRNRSVNILLVQPRSCSACGGRWASSLATEEGIKCRTLNVDSLCRRCGARIETSFCIPEIAP